MIGQENYRNKLALDLCSKLEQKKDSLTVFDFVSKSEFIQTLYDLINSNGESIYQSKNTCGIAALMYLSACNDIYSFALFAIDLYQNGIGILNDYRITKQHNLTKWSTYAKPKGSFNGVSLVVIGSIRFVENTSIRFNQGTMDGMTWPIEINRISKKTLANVLVKKSSNLLGFNIAKLKKTLIEGDEVILLYRTSSWNKKGRFFKDSWHYIVVIKLVVLENEKIEITYWDYGLIKHFQLSKFKFYSSIIKTFVFSKI